MTPKELLLFKCREHLKTTTDYLSKDITELRSYTLTKILSNLSMCDLDIWAEEE